MSEPKRQWQGIDVPGAPFVAHLVSDVAEWTGSVPSLCGQERRRKWRPVQDFARPDVFTRCDRCARLGGEG